MANPNSTSPARSAATPTYPNAGNSTPVRSPTSSLPPSVTTASLQSGHPPSNARTKRPAFSPPPQKATTSSNGKPWTNWTRAPATASRTKRSRTNTRKISKRETTTNTTIATGAENPTVTSSSDSSPSSWNSNAARTSSS